MAKINAHVTGWGMAVPEKVLSNFDLEKMVDTENEWIIQRTGISNRHIAGNGETTASLSIQAAKDALQKANITPDKVDLIIVATSTPDYSFPSTAAIVQDRIGAVNGGGFDLSAACSGFIFGLGVASQMIEAGGINTAVVIGAETLSRIVNWNDRETCILFGDGAGAFVLQGSTEKGGILSSVIKSDGSGGDLLKVPAGGSAIPTSHESVNGQLHYLQMNGREVFRFATRVMAKVSEEALSKADLTTEDVELIIPHQANIRIIESAAKRLKLPLERFAIYLEDYGNTSAASIPIAAVRAFEDDRIAPNDVIVMTGFGAGLTWGAAVIEWTGPIAEKAQFSMYQFNIFTRLLSFMKRVLRRIESLFVKNGK